MQTLDKVELQISLKDWLYIIIVGSFFGFFIALFFYFLGNEFKNSSTLFFGVVSAVFITVFSSVFITISNNYILPKLEKKYWYIISFAFSFLSGAIGFFLSFILFDFFDTTIAKILEDYSIYLTFTVGCLTFLVGLILHQFISMKYKNESIKSKILQSQIKALENELNPHFLFNALNSISELIYVDKQKAEESVLSLSKFLRNALDQKQSLITLEEELGMVQTYLKIENVRFSDKIKLETNIDESYKNILIPKFSIQLIVENGIKHGFEAKQLVFDITTKNNYITVSNNGKINPNIKFGTGLSNLHQRLELLGVGSLEYETKEKMKFKIKLKGK